MKIKTIAVICPLRNMIFRDLANALCLSCKELGKTPLRLSKEHLIKEHVNDIDLAIVLTPFDYPDIRQWLPKSKIALYQLETLPWPHLVHPSRAARWRWPSLKRLIEKNYDVVFDHNQSNIRLHLKQSISWGRHRPLVHLPIGYSSVFDLKEEGTPNGRVLFVGNVSDKPWAKHRRRVLRFLRDKHCKVTHIDGIYGKEALRLERDAAINLNIHGYDIPVFESPRIIQHIFSNKGFVISEPCEMIDTFIDGIHWRVVSAREMPGLIQYYLKNIEERLQIAENAYNYVKCCYTMTQHLQRALKEVK